MKKLSHKQIATYSAGGIVALLAISVYLAYFTPSRDPLTVTAKRFYPAIIVGSRVVSVNDMEQAKLVAATFGVHANDAVEKEIRTEKSIILARKLNVRISDDQIADETLYYTKGNDSEYRQLLSKHYDGSERQFYKFVVIPQVVDAQLRIKYNNDITGTSPAYIRAQRVLERLAKGERFEDLARTESADTATAQIGGDLGFYEAGQLLPELEDQVSVSATGEARKDILVSRLGYHLIFPVEYSTVNGKKLWHAKHMLFPTEGYDQWLNSSLKDISVLRILN
jgi:hypothetical protein